MTRRPNGYLSEEKNIIYDYKKRAKEGKKLNPYAVEKDDQSLYDAIIKHFDSFDDFLEQAGFNPEEVRLQQRWTLEKIKKELDKLYKNDVIINYHNKNKYYSKRQFKVFRMLIYYFDTIKKGLEHFDYVLENHYLKRLCPKCKTNIIDKKNNNIICDECNNKRKEN